MLLSNRASNFLYKSYQKSKFVSLSLFFFFLNPLIYLQHMCELELSCFVRSDIGLMVNEISILVLPLSLATGDWLNLISPSTIPGDE